MRGSARQKQYVWFTTSIPGAFNGYDFTERYSKPKRYLLSVSATSGDPEIIGTDNVPNYKRYITSFDPSFDLPEGTYAFVDKEPILDRTGQLVLDSDGNYLSVPDYVVRRPIKTRNGNVAKYVIEKRVEDKDAQTSEN